MQQLICACHACLIMFCLSFHFKQKNDEALNNTRKDQVKTLQLCLYCSSGGHLETKCPQRKSEIVRYPFNNILFSICMYCNWYLFNTVLPMIKFRMNDDEWDGKLQIALACLLCGSGDHLDSVCPQHNNSESKRYALKNVWLSIYIYCDLYFLQVVSTDR